MDASPSASSRGAAFAASVPERGLRALAAVAGGVVHETAALVLPRVVRRSRLYEATAKNALRIAIELVGGVEGAPTKGPSSPAREIALRKGAGNGVELGSIAAFGFSPLWLLAGASDLVRGTRTYLEALTEELERARVLPEGVKVETVDELLGVLERTSGRSARLIDVPPLELVELRRSLAELAADVKELPTAADLVALFDGLQRTARAEERSLLEVSSGLGLAFLASARNVSRDHVAVPYADDWKPLRREGVVPYARRVSRPYAEAVSGHFDPARTTWTERVLARVSRRRSTR